MECTSQTEIVQDIPQPATQQPEGVFLVASKLRPEDDTENLTAVIVIYIYISIIGTFHNMKSRIPKSQMMALLGENQMPCLSFHSPVES